MKAKTVSSAFIGLTVGLALSVTPVSAENGSRKVKKVAVRGVITAMDSASVSVGSKVILITSKTKFEDFLGGDTTFAALHLGDCVKVKLVSEGSTLKAREVELESSCTQPSDIMTDPIATPTTTPSTTPTSGHDLNDDRGRDRNDSDEDLSDRDSGKQKGSRGRTGSHINTTDDSNHQRRGNRSFT